ncbi:MAG: vWA domain-containing protein [Patescibacteria group bacterium]
MHFIIDFIIGVVWMDVVWVNIGIALSLALGIVAWWLVGRYRTFTSLTDLGGSPHERTYHWFGARLATALFAGLVLLFGMLGRADPQHKMLVPDVQYAGACVGIGIDSSFSMLALERYGATRTRLERAFVEIESLVGSFPPGDRLSLMAFAATAEVFAPRWSNDRHLFFTSLRHINESYVALYGRTGSDIPSAMGKWFTVLPEGDSCQVFIILFTDGEPEGDESVLAQQLVSSLQLFSQSNRSVITFFVAIGDDTKPLRIREYDSAGQFGGFAVKDDGSYIFTRPDIAYLSDIAVRFHGKLIFTEHGDENLQYKISSSIAEARKIAAMRSKVVYRSVAPWCAAGFLIALICLLPALMRI